MMIFNGFQKNSSFYSPVTLVTTLTDNVSNRFQKNSTFYSLVTLVTTLADDDSNGFKKNSLLYSLVPLVTTLIVKYVSNETDSPIMGPIKGEFYEILSQLYLFFISDALYLIDFCGRWILRFRFKS